MSPEPAPARPEDLLAHTGWVRALAGALVRDPSAADDLAQDALLAALEKPPSTDRPLRPWFAGVVRNLWRERRRGDARRTRREEARGPGAGPLPGPDELAARVETHRLLAEMVAGLAEPFRSTVILRFYEDLSSAEIARRAGLPEGTVRWRLKRGLDDLRERLDARNGGDRRAWMALLLPLAGRDGAAVGGITGGAVAMGAATKAAVAVVAVAGLGAFWFLSPGEPTSAPSIPVVPGKAPLARAPEVTPVAVAKAPEETPPAAPVPATAAETRPGWLTGRVLLPGGAPLPGAAVSWLPDGEETTSGSDGRFRLEIPCAADGTYVRLAARATAKATAMTAAVAKPGEEVAVGDLVLAAGGTVSGTVVDAAGAPVAGAVVGAEGVDVAGADLDDLRRRSAVDLARGDWNRTDATGRFRIEGVPTGTHRFWAGAAAFLSTGFPGVEVREGEETAGVRIVLELLAPEDTVEGFVAGPDGKPVADAIVQFTCDGGNRSMASSIPADEEGRFSLRLPFRGTTSFTARRKDDAGGAVTVTGIAPGARAVALRLGEAKWLLLRVRDRQGRVVSRFAASVDNADQASVGAMAEVAEHENGETRVLLPSFRFSLLLRAPGYLPAVLGPHEPGGTPEVLDAVLDRAATLRGRVTAGGKGVAGATVSMGKGLPTGIRYEVNGLLSRFESANMPTTTTGPDGTFSLDIVEAGTCHLLAEAPGYATGEAGPLDIDPSRSVDGAEIPLGRGGTIEGRVLMPAGRGAEGIVVCATRADGRPRTVRVGPDGKYRFEGLTAGPWQVMDLPSEPSPVARTLSRGGGSSTLAANCRVEEGATTTFDFDLAAKEETVLRGTFRLGEGSMEGWTAYLVDEGILGSRGQGGGTLGADGKFEVRGRAPGRCRILLVGPGDTTLALDALDLRAGPNDWSLSLASGNASGKGPAGAPLALVIPLGGGRFALVSPATEPDGSFKAKRIPAGTANVVVVSEESLGREADPLRWPAVSSVKVE